MVNWESVRYFVALADTGTLSGAARMLNVEHATIARRVAALESETSLKLVDRRGGRRFLLTEDGGERIAAIARKMQDEAQAISRLGAVRDTGISATVTLTAPPSYAVARLARPLAAISAQYPGIHMRVMGEARFSSLNRREADIAIRLTRPTTGDLTIRRLGEEAFRPYASRHYLARTRPEEWHFIAYDESLEDAPQQAYLLALAGTRPIALRANTLEMQLALVSENAGIAMLPDFMAETQEHLVPALPDHAPLLREVWMVVHSDMKAVPALRAVMAEIAGAPPNHPMPI
ncbi:LysR family transcriptional regulator [Brucella intermedia 229E]|uniref:LysR family transcriptional regulator n=1 Tax=Brucella intermedia 229E TaxID=1337887 RepID=U4V4C3_9HYPH|nr:LysR family transcriptional regulator [Brucella intermedia 229E]